MNNTKLKGVKDICHVTEVFESTGEVIGYTKLIYTDEKIAKDNEIKNNILSSKELHQYLRDEIGYFFFYFYKKLDAVDIQPQYKLRFLYLASYLDYDSDNIIDRGQYNTKLKLNKQNLRDILLLKETEFNTTLKILVDSGLLVQDDKHYKLNTGCSVKGTISKNSKNYTRVFITSIRELYENCEPKKHRQLYYLFKILPHVNLQFNIVCSNTDAEIVEDIKPFSMRDICNVIGYEISHKSRLFNDLRKFTINKNYVISKHSVDDIDAIAINPRLFYAGTRVENVKYLQSIFDMVKNLKTSPRTDKKVV